MKMKIIKILVLGGIINGSLGFTQTSASLRGEVLNGGTPYLTLEYYSFFSFRHNNSVKIIPVGIGINFGSKKWDEIYEIEGEKFQSKGHIFMIGGRSSMFFYDDETTRLYSSLEINLHFVNVDYYQGTLWQKDFYVGCELFPREKICISLEAGIGHIEKLYFPYNIGVKYYF